MGGGSGGTLRAPKVPPRHPGGPSWGGRGDLLTPHGCHRSTLGSSWGHFRANRCPFTIMSFTIQNHTFWHLEGRLGDPKVDEERPKTRDGTRGIPRRELGGPEGAEGETEGTQKHQSEGQVTHGIS